MVPRQVLLVLTLFSSITTGSTQGEAPLDKNSTTEERSRQQAQDVENFFEGIKDELDIKEYECKVEKYRSGGQILPCQFPFIYDEKEFDGCTTYDDPDDNLWCSTKVNENHMHVSGGRNFGFCTDPLCQLDSQLSLERILLN